MNTNFMMLRAWILLSSVPVYAKSKRNLIAILISTGSSDIYLSLLTRLWLCFLTFLRSSGSDLRIARMVGGMPADRRKTDD